MSEYIWKDVRRWIVHLYLILGLGVFLGTASLHPEAQLEGIKLIGVALIYCIVWPGVLLAHFLLGAPL